MGPKKGKLWWAARNFISFLRFLVSHQDVIGQLEVESSHCFLSFKLEISKIPRRIFTFAPAVHFVWRLRFSGWNLWVGGILNSAKVQKKLLTNRCSFFQGLSRLLHFFFPKSSLFSKLHFYYFYCTRVLFWKQRKIEMQKFLSEKWIIVIWKPFFFDRCMKQRMILRRLLLLLLLIVYFLVHGENGPLGNII